MYAHRHSLTLKFWYVLWFGKFMFLYFSCNVVSFIKRFPTYPEQLDLTSQYAANISSIWDLFSAKDFLIFSLVTQSWLTLWDPVDCSKPNFPVIHHLPKFAQTHVHWVSDAIQPSHPLDWETLFLIIWLNSVRWEQMKGTLDFFKTEELPMRWT